MYSNVSSVICLADAFPIFSGMKRHEKGSVCAWNPAASWCSDAITHKVFSMTLSFTFIWVAFWARQ